MTPRLKAWQRDLIQMHRHHSPSWRPQKGCCRPRKNNPPPPAPRQSFSSQVPAQVPEGTKRLSPGNHLFSAIPLQEGYLPLQVLYST